MQRLMVHVDETPLHIWEHLNLVLELLANVVRLVKRRIRRHDNVNLHEVGGAGVVRADRVDLRDLIGERRHLVDDELEEVVRRRKARELAELKVDGTPPGSHDTHADLT